MICVGIANICIKMNPIWGMEYGGLLKINKNASVYLQCHAVLYQYKTYTGCYHALIDGRCINLFINANWMLSLAWKLAIFFIKNAPSAGRCNDSCPHKPPHPHTHNPRRTVGCTFIWRYNLSMFKYILIILCYLDRSLLLKWWEQLAVKITLSVLK